VSTRETLRHLSDCRCGTSDLSYNDRLFDQRRFFSGKKRNRQRTRERECYKQQEARAVRAALVPKISDQHWKNSFGNPIRRKDHTHDSAEHAQSEQFSGDERNNQIFAAQAYAEHCCKQKHRFVARCEKQKWNRASNKDIDQQHYMLLGETIGEPAHQESSDDTERENE